MGAKSPQDAPQTAPEAENVTPFRGAKPCPICSKKSTHKYHPFCSKHCADVDLNRWLTGSYAIPAAEEPEDWSED